MTAPRLCSDCGAPAVAFRAGTDEVRELFLLVAAQPDRAWCSACWGRRFVPEACDRDLIAAFEQPA